MNPPAVVPEIGEVERAALQAVSPLAVDLHWQCGPVRVPAALAAATGMVQAQNSSASRALRTVLAQDPWEGTGPVNADGWVLVAADAESLVFAQRRGPVGIEAVLVLARGGEGWEPVSLGGVRLVLADPAERVERVQAATVEGATVLPVWGCDADPAGRPHRVLRRVEVLETPTEVHLLVVSGPDPAEVRARGSAGGAVGWSVGVEVSVRSAVVLAEPLGQRVLRDDSGVPAHVVEVGEV